MNKNLKIGLGFLAFALGLLLLLLLFFPPTKGLDLGLNAVIGGKPTAAARRAARLEGEAPPDIPIETLPVERIAAYREIAEENGMHAVYCKWPSEAPPTYIPFNKGPDGRPQPAPHQFFIVEGGWLFGFVDSPDGTTYTRQAEDESRGLGGGKPIRFNVVSWSPKDDRRSMACEVELSVPVQFELIYTGDEDAKVSLTGCGLRSAAIFGLHDGVMIDSNVGHWTDRMRAAEEDVENVPQAPLTWYGRSGPCALEAQVWLNPSGRTADLAPIRAHLKAGQNNIIRITVPELPPMTLADQIRQTEELIKETEDEIDFRRYDRREEQLAKNLETEQLMEAMFDDPRLSPRAQYELDDVLIITSAHIEKDEAMLNGRDDPMAGIYEESLAHFYQRLKDLKAQQGEGEGDE